MNGVNELITVKRYWETWADPRFVVLVLSNDDLSFVSWETRGMLGEAPDPQSQSLPEVPYADWARLLGLGGETSATARRSARRGTAPWPPTGRSSSTRRSTRTSRWCRRT